MPNAYGPKSIVGSAAVATVITALVFICATTGNAAWAQQALVGHDVPNPLSLMSKPSPPATYKPNARGTRSGFMGIPVKDLTDDELSKSPRIEWLEPPINPQAAEIKQLCQCECDYSHDGQFDKAEEALNRAIKLNEPYFDSGLYSYLAGELGLYIEENASLLNLRRFKKQCPRDWTSGIPMVAHRKHFDIRLQIFSWTKDDMPRHELSSGTLSLK
ncbi:MAG: hypothetical protein ACRDHZ_23765 [Ktedonobacteraceae bacterium]